MTNAEYRRAPWSGVEQLLGVSLMSVLLLGCPEDPDSMGSGGSAQTGTPTTGTPTTAGTMTAAQTEGSGGSTSGSADGTGADSSSDGGSEESSGGDDPPVGLCPEGKDYGNPVPDGATPTLVADGFRGAEGVVWSDVEQALFFSEIDRNKPAEVSWQDQQSGSIIRLDPSDGSHEIWVAESGTNGLALSIDGQSLVAASFATRSLLNYTLPDPVQTELVPPPARLPFNAPNDIAIRSDGTIYFTDPTWHLEGANGGMPEPGSMRVYRVSPEGDVSIVDDTLTQPNGISLSPDERTLYVTSVYPDSLAPNWTVTGYLQRFDVMDDGSTANGALFTELQGAGPDGMAIDCAGNIYLTVTRGQEGTTPGVEIYDPDAQLLGTLTFGDPPLPASNAAFGGPDRTTLYVTVEQNNPDPAQRVFGVYGVELNIPGFPY
ncbi:MAG: SMP-30/gluconolactonase/LRE family protein [Myxococcota bacterium]